MTGNVPLFATGRALLVDAWLDLEYVKSNREHFLSQLSAALPQTWTPGPLDYDLRDIEKTSSHIRNTVKIDELERSENFSISTSKLLFGQEAQDGKITRGSELPDGAENKAALRLRYHTRDPEKLNAALDVLSQDLGQFSHTFTGAELIVAPSYASAPSRGALEQNPSGGRVGKHIFARRRAVLILHLGDREDPLGNNERTLTDQDALWLYQAFRVTRNRINFLHELQRALDQNAENNALRVITPPASTLASHEYYGAVYPVLTDLTLNLFRDDDQAILIRELATVTKSEAHGSQGASDREQRIARTRDERQRVRLSESWAAMLTRHGALFFAVSRDDINSFPEARLYVSTLYVDYIALTRIEASITRDFWNGLQESVQSQQDLDVTDALQIRRRLMGLRSSYAKVGQGENNIGKRLVEQMREILGSEIVQSNIIEESLAIVELAELKQSKKEEHSSKSLERILNFITFVGLPILLLDVAVSVHSAGTGLQNVFYGLLVGLILIGAIFGLRHYLWHKRSKIQEGDE